MCPACTAESAKKKPTTLNLEAWTHELDNDIDKQFILDGISDGFYLIDKNIRLEPAEMENYRSSTSQHALVEAQIRREISKGRYVVTPSKPTIVSAIGAIPKGPNAVRLIHDGSKPIGRGLNDYVSTKMDIRYQSIQSASDLITHGCYLGKLDLKSAYRSVSIHPSQFQCTGLKWKFKGHSEYTYMYDNRLPFGAKLSVGIFHRLTQAVRRMLLKRGINVQYKSRLSS